MIEPDHDERVRLGLVEHAAELAHGSDGRVKLRRILTGLAEKKRRRVAGNHSSDNLSHDFLSKTSASEPRGITDPWRPTPRSFARPSDPPGKDLPAPSSDTSARTFPGYRARTPNALPGRIRRHRSCRDTFPVAPSRNNVCSAPAPDRCLVARAAAR